jgi:hypothetical protein
MPLIGSSTSEWDGQQAVEQNFGRGHFLAADFNTVGLRREAQVIADAYNRQNQAEFGHQLAADAGDAPQQVILRVFFDQRDQAVADLQFNRVPPPFRALLGRFGFPFKTCGTGSAWITRDFFFSSSTKYAPAAKAAAITMKGTLGMPAPAPAVKR